ncbi:F-box domain-containing protein [Mycena sanguinolenta]|uniref:F-box domain-containing protein n=1 Tax=Mycena sanguinolenta TaxID=230812 RepID=A0A8H7DCQ9_9AGAR|nr:F-box domain-containing protein [Mycena sanguinolenta]
MFDRLNMVTIFSLPNELLEAIAAAGQEERIAELYSSYHDRRLGGGGHFGVTDNPSSSRDFKSEWTLSHVSHRFRDVIVGAPALWTLIDAYRYKRRLVEILELYFQRSRFLEFSATLCGLIVIINPAILAQVLQHADRMKTLRFELSMAGEVEGLRSSLANVAAPHLQRLEIEYRDHDSETVAISLFSATPRLSFLKIRGSLELPTAPWAALTHLELQRFLRYDDDPRNFEYFSTVIKKCPMLVHLRIHIFFEVAGRDQVHIPTLKFLHVWIPGGGEHGDPGLLHAVNLFDTPALTEFVAVFDRLFPALISFSFISEDHGSRCDTNTYTTVDSRISPRSFAPFPALSTLTLINICFTASLVQDLWGPDSLPWPLLKSITLCPPAILFEDVRSALQAAMDSKRQCGQPFPEVKLFHPLGSPKNWRDESFADVEDDSEGDETVPEEV